LSEEQSKQRQKKKKEKNAMCTIMSKEAPDADSGWNGMHGRMGQK